ncbi:unnamed protein product [Blepharisma stoltei]|uniref:SDE2-like domain-containing protein n=1 Tax=Blepharisma stoltei TaxID=1481888 RepID=A0AAU9KNW3_9CILI|nr:unnamed protein product [Blepharisma stoltei]
MNKILVRGIDSKLSEFSCENYENFVEEYSEWTKIPREHLRISQCSRGVSEINPDFIVCVSLKVCGGKGGFGSLLRGQGMFARVDNFEACRDLNGRRIRHINDEIRLAQWKQKQAEKEEEERKKAEEKEEKVVVPAKRKTKADPNYKSAVDDCVKGVKSALAAGLKKKNDEPIKKAKIEEEDNEKDNKINDKSN